MRSVFAQSRTIISRAALAAAVVFSVAACGDDDTNSPTPVATNITVNSGSDAQSGVVGQALINPISVRVTDQNGNAMANAPVAWTVETGGGSVASATTSTDANGNTSVVWTLGPTAGGNTLKATLANNTSVTISATAAPATAAGLTLISGNGQILVGGGTSAALVVKAVDGSGAAVTGVSITWSTTGGTLSQATTATGADGTTSVTLTTPALPGVHTVTATATGGVTQTFTVTGT